MSDRKSRLEALSPERRRLLEQLLAHNSARAGSGPLPRPTAQPVEAAPHPLARFSTAAAAQPAASNIVFDLGHSQDETKSGYRRFYDAVNEQLDSSVFGSFSFFLNYGYVPTAKRQHSV